VNIGIIGVGRLGLAYALVFEQKNFTVYASSYKKDYVENLQNKKLETTEPGLKELLDSATNIEFTVDNHAVIDRCDFIYVLVATPSTNDGNYDVSAVLDIANDLLNHPGNVDGKILVIGSTVNPGTCQVVQDMLISRGVHVVYSPTFVAQGTVLNDIVDPHSVSIGTENHDVANRCKQVFGSIVSETTPIFVFKPLTAEILKLAGNCRAIMEISYFNMIGQILLDRHLDTDLDDACQYLNFIKKTSRWKFGFGYGGPCYPRDNRAFVHYTQTLGMDYPLGSVIDNFNHDHVEWLTNYFIARNEKDLPFYFNYITYKKGVSIMDESHPLEVCKNLLKKNKTIYIESTKFLLPEIQDNLVKEFTNQVKFVKIQELEDNSVYPINF
jgi:UDPglucose 6-dehydrogenase